VTATQAISEALLVCDAALEPFHKVVLDWENGAPSDSSLLVKE
jgi:hypothetical protein